VIVRCTLFVADAYRSCVPAPRCLPIPFTFWLFAFTDCYYRLTAPHITRSRCGVFGLQRTFCAFRSPCSTRFGYLRGCTTLRIAVTDCTRCRYNVTPPTCRGVVTFALHLRSLPPSSTRLQFCSPVTFVAALLQPCAYHALPLPVLRFTLRHTSTLRRYPCRCVPTLSRRAANRASPPHVLRYDYRLF